MFAQTRYSSAAVPLPASCAGASGYGLIAPDSGPESSGGVGPESYGGVRGYSPIY